MVQKREIGIYRWEDNRDGIVYRIHRYSDGTSWYEQIARTTTKGHTKRRSKIPIKAGASSTQKGRIFEEKVFAFAQKTVGDKLAITGQGRIPVIGASGPWRADIAINEHEISPQRERSIYLGPIRGVIECKSLSPSVSPGSYETALARGYALLNDIKIGNVGVRLFMVFNRNPVQGETPRDPRVLFRKIDALFVNFDDEADRHRFQDELAALPGHPAK